MSKNGHTEFSGRLQELTRQVDNYPIVRGLLADKPERFRSLLEAASTDEERAQALHLWGHCLMVEDATELAVGKLELALELSPTNELTARIQLMLSLCANRLGKTREAHALALAAQKRTASRRGSRLYRAAKKQRRFMAEDLGIQPSLWRRFCRRAEVIVQKLAAEPD